MEKRKDIQVEQSLILWTLKALHVVKKFHMAPDSIHQQFEETFKKEPKVCMKIKG